MYTHSGLALVTLYVHMEVACFPFTMTMAQINKTRPMLISNYSAWKPFEIANIEHEDNSLIRNTVYGPSNIVNYPWKATCA